jgi:epoxide hydrolase 4
MQELTYQIIRANSINLHVAIAGKPDGNPVILLHGFPDASFGWEKQIYALAEARFYVIAPDQRGYNLSDKPKGRTQYKVDFLAADILALADQLGCHQFNLAGHDFGAIVSWRLAGSHPERIKRLAILNVPHPKILYQYQKVSPEQRAKSWYAYFFQLPLLPELLLRSQNWKSLASSMCKALSEKELNRYRESWSQPGAITTMINWYRSIFPQPAADKLDLKIKVPTLIIWGKQDPHLMWQMAPESAAMCETGRLELIEDATHWVHQDQPEKVNSLLVDHFKSL